MWIISQPVIEWVATAEIVLEYKEGQIPGISASISVSITSDALCVIMVFYGAS